MFLGLPLFTLEITRDDKEQFATNIWEHRHIPV